MAPGANGLYVKRSQEAMLVPHSGVVNTIATGTFIGMNAAGDAVLALANSGSSQAMALGFALIGHVHGVTWSQNRTTRFDAVDNPVGFGEVNSGSYTPGLPLFLSGNGPVNISQTPPTNRGDLVQIVGFMETATMFRIHVGDPHVIQSGSSAQAQSTILWRGVALDE